MINITDKKNCVGCNACMQRCPKHCISMHEDEQGFLYPKVDSSKCVNCELCEKVCPVINQDKAHKPLETYAAKNTDEEIRKSSSSGGIFFALAKEIIDEGGVVFGAKFNEKWEVVHDYAETLDGVKSFQGSKYVQSRIGDSFIHTEKFLKQGRIVLFSGTPCQIAALRLFLKKDYGKQLIIVDIACHGVPSPLIWKDFLCSATTKHTIQSITDINFRDKRNGWDNYGMKICFATGKDLKEQYIPAQSNPFMKGFLKNLYLRPSCYECPAKCGKSHSDITLADFWGIGIIDSSSYDRRGVSLILINTYLGLEFFKRTGVWYKSENYDEASAMNPALMQNPILPKSYNAFWKDYDKTGINAITQTVEQMSPSHSAVFFHRAINKINSILRKPHK